MKKSIQEADIEAVQILNMPLAYYEKSKKNHSFGPNLVPSDVKVDIVIPVAEKDLLMLPITLAGIRKHLKHPIGRIYVIGKKDSSISYVATEQNCIFADEDTILPIKLQDIKYDVKKKSRSGWIFQQLLKMNCDAVSKNDNILVVDSDTVLVQAQKFEHDGKTILLAGDKYHEPYYVTHEKIFKWKTTAVFSFTAHQALFKAENLKAIRQEIESVNNKPWYQVIINNLDSNQISSFSEYETYGNWMLRNKPTEMLVEFFFNQNLNSTAPQSLEFYEQGYAKKFKSVSVHTYL